MKEWALSTKVQNAAFMNAGSCPQLCGHAPIHHLHGRQPLRVRAEHTLGGSAEHGYNLYLNIPWYETSCKDIETRLLCHSKYRTLQPSRQHHAGKGANALTREPRKPRLAGAA